MKILLIANPKLSQFLMKTFSEIGHESFRTSKTNGIMSIIRDFQRCDLIYAHAPYDLSIHILAKLFRKKIIVHWIGTDAYTAISNSLIRYKSQLCNLLINKQVVVSQLLKKELNSFGIKNSLVIPILPKFIKNEISNIEQKNKKFTVLTYAIPHRFEFYGGYEIMSLAEKLQDIDFWFLSECPDDKFRKLKNVRFMGILKATEMDSIYNNCHLLIRYVKHDGTPKMVLESLQKGLQVIYNFDFPHTHYCNSLEHMENKIKYLKDNFSINYPGREFVLQQYSAEHNKMLFKNLFNEFTNHKD